VVAQRFGHRERARGAGADRVERAEPAPEDPPGRRLDEPVGLLRVPGVDGVRRARPPEERGVLGPNAPPQRAADALALRLARDGELVEVRHVALARQHGRRPVRLGEVDAKGALLLEIGRVERPAEAALEQRPQPPEVDAVEAVVAAHPLAAAHERAGAAVGEELLGQVLGRGDRHRRGRRQLGEQRGDLVEAGAHLGPQPRLGDERLVVFGQVDRRHDRAVAVEQAAGGVQEDDLVRRRRARERPRRRVGRHDHDLPGGRLAERRHHGQVPGAHGGLERLAVHARDRAAARAGPGLGLEHARGEGPRPHAERLERFDEPQVELQVRAPRRVERPRRRVTGARRRPEPRLGERLRERRAAAVHDDRAQPHPVQERERRGERLERAAEQVARDAHHGRLGLALAGVVPQVLLDLFAAADVVQKLDDDVAGLVHGPRPSPPQIRA
jgi:hypothetical protein